MIHLSNNNNKSNNDYYFYYSFKEVTLRARYLFLVLLGSSGPGSMYL